MQKLPISLVIITLNEEKNIERCILSAPFVSDIVVVDSGSQDRTVDIARRLGARVTIEPWRGFAKQKIRATALALNEWVLSLDADEALSIEAQKEIVELMAQPLTANAYSFPRLTFHLGKWIHHSGMYPDYQARLFNRSQAKWLETNVHEKIQADKIVKLNHQIYHWSFENIAHQIETVNKYSSLRAKDFQANGKKFTSFMLITKTIGKFFETYIFKRGFRDGVPGLIISFVTAFSTCLRWAKLYEIEISQISSKESSQNRRKD